MSEEKELLHGMMAEFATPEAAVRAAGEARSRGFSRLEAFGPFPVPELAAAIGFQEHRIAPCVLGGGIAGGLLGYGLQYYCTVVAYPHNIGGRPLNSWPSFIPVTFEMTVLGAACVGLLAFFLLSGLPRLSHPVFAAPGFQRATRDRFFLCILADDPRFTEAEAKAALQAGDPLAINPIGKDAAP